MGDLTASRTWSLPDASGTVALTGHTHTTSEITDLSSWAGSSSIVTVGTITTGTWNGTTISVSSGGTGQTSAALGELLHGTAIGGWGKLAGNTTITKMFLSQTGTGSVSAIPAWTALSKTDVGLSNVENTALSTWAGSSNITTVGNIINGLTAHTVMDNTWEFIFSGVISEQTSIRKITAANMKSYFTGGLTFSALAAGFSIAGGTTSKTLTVSNTLTFAGTDSSTLNIGTGGTLGSAAFTASTAYEPSISSGTTSQFWRGDKSWQSINIFGAVYADTGSFPYQIPFVAGSGNILSQTADLRWSSGGGLIIGGDVGGTLTVYGDITTNSRLKLDAGTTNADGIAWGTDVYLYRSATDTLKTDSTFIATDGLTTNGRVLLDAGTTNADGIAWGTDIYLYRSATGVLALTGAFQPSNGYRASGGNPGVTPDPIQFYDDQNTLWSMTIENGIITDLSRA